MQELSTIIDIYRHIHTKKEKAYLLSFDVKTSNFYDLSKKKPHKSQIIEDVCKIADSSYNSVESPADLKIRPIFAGPTCEIHRIRISYWIFLNLTILKYSHIRETVDFLDTIHEKKIIPNPV